MPIQIRPFDETDDAQENFLTLDVPAAGKGTELFDIISDYDKQSMPSEWEGPTGPGGYASNWRHAGNTALLKNKISNTISPYVGKTIGDIGGGITSFGGGLLHELNAESRIFKDRSGIADPFLLDAGQTIRFNPDFKEDMTANLFGAWKGQTGIEDTEVLKRLSEDMSQDDAWSDYLENLALQPTKGGFYKTRRSKPTINRKPWEPRFTTMWGHGRTLPLTRREWVEKMKNRKEYNIPTLGSDTRNVTRGPDGGGGAWSPSGADLSPGGGPGQSPTGRDVQGTPFSRGGILGVF